MSAGGKISAEIKAMNCFPLRIRNCRSQKLKKLITNKQKEGNMKKVNLDQGHTYPYALVTARPSEFILLFPAVRVSRTRK